MGCEVYHSLGKIIKAKFGGDATLIGDDGGFAPPYDNREGKSLYVKSVLGTDYLVLFLALELTMLYMYSLFH